MVFHAFRASPVLTDVEARLRCNPETGTDSQGDIFEEAITNSREAVEFISKNFHKRVESPQPFPKAALDARHNGTVLVLGTLGVDGVFRNPAIRKSSGSSILDAAEMLRKQSAISLFDEHRDRMITYCRAHPDRRFRKVANSVS